MCLLGCHLYSADSMRAGFQIAARTQVQTIEMHTVCHVQGSCRSVIVRMHCFSHLTLFSSLLKVSDLQHPSSDPICNRK